MSRWAITTAHLPEHKAIKIIEALPAEMVELFSMVPDDFLMSTEGVEYVLNQVKLHSGVRPGDETTEIMRRVFDNARRKDEGLATYVIRRTQDWKLSSYHGISGYRGCRGELTRFWPSRYQ